MQRQLAIQICNALMRKRHPLSIGTIFLINLDIGTFIFRIIFLAANKLANYITHLILKLCTEPIIAAHCASPMLEKK